MCTMIPACKVQLPNNLSGKFLDTLVQRVPIFFFVIWYFLKYNTTVHNFGNGVEIMLWSEANGCWGLNIESCITWSQSKIWDSWSTFECYSSHDATWWHYECNLQAVYSKMEKDGPDIKPHFAYTIHTSSKTSPNKPSLWPVQTFTQHYLHGRVNPPWHPPTSTDQQVKWTLWLRVHCDILWSKETKAAQMQRKHQVYPHSGGYHHNTHQKQAQRKDNTSGETNIQKKSHRAGAADSARTSFTSWPGNWTPFWRILSVQRRD